jgi:hypothetical protein
MHPSSQTTRAQHPVPTSRPIKPSRHTAPTPHRFPAPHRFPPPRSAPRHPALPPPGPPATQRSTPPRTPASRSARTPARSRPLRPDLGIAQPAHLWRNFHARRKKRSQKRPLYLREASNFRRNCAAGARSCTSGHEPGETSPGRDATRAGRRRRLSVRVHCEQFALISQIIICRRLQFRDARLGNLADMLARLIFCQAVYFRRARK